MGKPDRQVVCYDATLAHMDVRLLHLAVLTVAPFRNTRLFGDLLNALRDARRVPITRRLECRQTVSSIGRLASSDSTA